MDDDQPTLNEGETETPTESSSVETTEETPQAGAEPAGQTETPNEDVETGEGPKKGAQQRIRELNQAKKDAEAKAQGLEQKLAAITGGSTPRGGQNVPQIQPGQEVTPEQYRQHVISQADALVNLRMAQSDAVHRINSEASETIRKYPQLDPENESFDKELSESVTEATEAYVRANPYGASVKKFVDKLMQPYQRAVTKEVGRATSTIAKQVSEGALRPTSIRSGEKQAKDMTPEELEKKLGVVW